MSATKNTHGGKRKNAGPNELPKGELKKELTVYIEQKYIDEFGGKKKLKEEIKKFVYRTLVHRRLVADGLIKEDTK